MRSESMDNFHLTHFLFHTFCYFWLTNTNTKMPLIPPNTKQLVLLLLFLVVGFTNNTTAQFNFLTGASYGSISLKEVNSRIREANSSLLSWDEIKSWYGLSLGARYKYEAVALNVGVLANFQKIESNAPDIEEKINIKNTAVYLGPEFFIPSTPISFGANIAYDSFKLTYKSTLNDGLLFMDEKGWNTQIYLSLNLSGGGLTSLVIRPYYTVSFSEYDFTSLLAQIDEVKSNNSFPVNSFGLSLIFANGPSN